MKRVSRLLIRLYPAWWRNRYGQELEALVEDSGSHDVWDLLRGAMEMQMKTWSFGRTVTVCGLVGVVVAGAAAFSGPQLYQSTATLKLDKPDPDALDRVVEAALPRNALVSIINDYNLYPRERKSMPMEDVTNKVMYREVWITPVAPNLARVSFYYEDPVQAQRVSQDLVGRIIAANVATPNGGVIQLVAPADQAKRIIGGQVRRVFGLGLPVSLLFGVVLALILRRRTPIR